MDTTLRPIIAGADWLACRRYALSFTWVLVALTLMPGASVVRIAREYGEDISEMLDFVPGYFKVLRHVRPKLSCGHYYARVIQLPAPSRPIERGIPAPGLPAQVLAAKYADRCPLYRQQAIYQQADVDLDRATLVDWVGAVARLLEPLVDVVSRYVLAAEKVHADDTPVPVLDGKT